MQNEKNTKGGSPSPIIRPIKELTEKEIDTVASSLSVSFQGYPLFEFFSNYKYDVSKMKKFWGVTLKTFPNSAKIISCNEEFESLAILIPTNASKVSVWKYLRSGGIGMICKIGLSHAKKMLQFDAFAEKIKSRHSTGDCLYIYSFVTLPECRGRGLGSKTLHDLLQFLDENRQDCYLETMSEINVKIYKKYGFELMESTRIPGSDMTLYAMLRKYKP